MRYSHFVLLAAPGEGVLMGTWCADRATAQRLLDDRKANGEAFPGELVVRVPCRVYCKLAQAWVEAHFGYPDRT
jgi:hypothetical protein